MKMMTLCLAALLPLGPGCLPAAAATPDTVQGLVAWYDVSTMHEKTRGGTPVDIWPDASGAGHDLTDERDGLTALFEVQQVGGLPAVKLRKGNSHRVSEPFALEDHTLFIVHSARCRNCALLQSTEPGEDGFGIVLHGAEGRHQLKRGRQRAAYTAPVRGRQGYSVTALGRHSGVLRGFVNGIDISAVAEESGTLNVGRMFRVSETKAVKLDADGLSVSELIFYDRFLDPEERNAVTVYLAEKYAIALDGVSGGTAVEPPAEEQVWVRLTSAEAQDVNSPELTAVRWAVAETLDGPFRHDAENEPSSLYCTRDGTKVRLWVSLLLSTSAEGADVGFSLLKNREQFLPGAVETGPLAAPTGVRKVEISLGAEVELSAGDYVELVALARGAAGEVKLVPRRVELVVAAE